MSKFRKAALIIIGLVLGTFLGALYSGLYFVHRIMVNGKNITDLSESEIMSAMMENSDSLVQETFISFFGFGGFWIDGSWPLWFSLVAFAVAFGWIGNRINGLLEERKKEENLDQTE